MAGRVFDDNGGIWSSTSTEFSATFATHGSGLSSGEYAVKALGFVVVDQFGSTAQVRLAPATVSARALLDAMDWLKGQRYDRISIAYCEDVWRYDFASSIDDAAARITDKIGRSARAVLDPVIWRKTDRADIAQSPALMAMFREWREVVGSGVLVDPVQFAHRHLQQRHVVARRRAANDAMVFDSIGTGFHYYGETWAQASLGQPLRSQPDPIYGAWVAESYDQAPYIGEPTVHDVDAVIRPQKGRMARLRIRRVVLPLPGAGDEKLVIGGSFYDDAVDLRRVPEGVDDEHVSSELSLQLKNACRKIAHAYAG